MAMFSKLKISHKLPALVVLLALCTAAVISWTSYNKSKTILIHEIETRLLSMVQNTASGLETWGHEIRTDLDEVSSHPTTRLALQEFTSGWEALPGDKTFYLKSEYITKNPNPVGSKEHFDYAFDGSKYSEAHKTHHTHFRKHLQAHDYYDIFLFDTKGNLVYSVFKEQDYATNFNTGEWSQSDLGRAFRDARSKSATVEQQFYDFNNYGPSNNAPASFISMAVNDEAGRFIGVLAYQIPVGRLDEIMQRHAGLGETGESFLVGVDKMMRSDSRFSEISTILKRKIDTVTVAKVFAGETGVMVESNFEGKEVISAYTPIEMLSVKWGVFVEQEMTELEAPLIALKKQIYIQLGLAFLVLAAIGFAFARSISKPIAALVGSIDTLASGDLTHEIPYKDKQNELGLISNSMGVLQDNLAKGDVTNRISLYKGSAFDGSSLAMMMIDRDLIVTFVNKSTMEMFGEFSTEFETAFPSFKASEIIGTCIDVFHKRPEHQRAILADPSRMPFKADISVGDLKFALNVNIIKDEEGKHIGNTLEWDHVTIERTNSGIMSALNRESALIEFNMDGTIITANENFLSTVGYSLEEIKGKHHRMFVGEAYRSSTEYANFWTRLNTGEVISDKFERFGKNGNTIWLQAAYNAVVDITGKPFKVVKIASDITKIENDRVKNEADIARHAKEQEQVVSTLARSLKMLSEGDLTHKIEEEFTGDYTQLRSDFNSAIETLNGTMKNIVGNAVGIQNGAREISQASDDMAKRTENQAAALEETAAALDEITATVQGSAKSADQANTVVTDTRNEAEKSGEVVRKAVEAMDAIKDSSGEIEKIIGVIDEIAFQTNLLALNAGVEAARAGEAGRGFAVVASEVRALAQRSSDAAKDIKTLISASGKHVETGVDLVGQTGIALEKIVTSVAEVSTLVESIAGSAQEQSVALGEVNSAVNDMDRVTQQNAAMVEESTAAAHALTNEAQELTRLVRQFDIGDGVAETAHMPSARQSAPVVQQQQQRAQAYFKTQGSAAVAVNEDDWQDF